MGAEIQGKKSVLVAMWGALYCPSVTTALMKCVAMLCHVPDMNCLGNNCDITCEPYTNAHFWASKLPLVGLRPLACWDRSFESHQGAWIFVCCECCVLSGLCDELITHPEGCYRLWCVVVCDLETTRMRRLWPSLGHSATGNEKKKPQITDFVQRNM